MDIISGVAPNYVRTRSTGSGTPIVAIGQQFERSRRSLRDEFVQLAGLCLGELQLSNANLFPRDPIQQGARSPLFPSKGTAAYAGQGTISQTLTTITGTGTNFLREVIVGDRLRGGVANGINGIVTAVTDNVTITISTSASVSDGAFAITR